MIDWEKEASDEVLIELLLSNSIGRNDQLAKFMYMLDKIPARRTIALNGKWGSGKTFFVKQLVMLINAKNSLRPEGCIDKRLKDFIGNSTSAKNCIALRYDAWENDDDNDPILSLVYNITKELNVAFSYNPNQMEKIARIGGWVLDSLLNTNSTELIRCLQEYTEGKPLNDIVSKKELKKKIHEYFESICVNGERRVFIFIDELDRCSPVFAVKLLERIKHYFVNDKVTFIFSINLEQLQHTVKKYYGDDFDACGYLHRFFYTTVSLPNIDNRKFYLFNGWNDDDAFADVSKAVIEMHQFSLRDIGRFFNMSNVIAGKIRNAPSNSLVFEQKSLLFVAHIIVPILTGIFIKDYSLYEKVVSGEGKEEFISCMNECSQLYFSNQLLLDNESFFEETGKVKVEYEDKYAQLYDGMFPDNQTTNSVNIGKLTFTRQIRKQFMEMMSMLSSNSNFD